jgi:hypothetical protein
MGSESLPCTEFDFLMPHGSMKGPLDRGQNLFIQATMMEPSPLLEGAM